MNPKQIQIISREGNPRAILIFLGWGMDAVPFQSLRKPGYDLIAAYDYAAQAPAIDSRLQGYSEIVVVAWSFGVRAATDFLASTTLPVTRTIAVNGTRQHVHDTLGIPHAIFQGTLKGLSPASVEKFRRRMCGSAASYEGFRANAPQRDFDSLKSELQEFADTAPSSSTMQWTHVVISGRDMIFPMQAQQRAWDGQASISVLEDAPHLPDFQKVLDRFVIDKELVAQRFSQASETYTRHATVQAQSAAHLWELLKTHLKPGKKYGNIIEIGAGSGLLTRLYSTSLTFDSLQLWDIASIDRNLILERATAVNCDAESRINAIADNSIDMLLSASTLQWFNSPETFIRRASAKITRGGIMALSFYAPGTCSQLSSAGMALNYPSPKSCADAAQKVGLTVLHLSEETQTITFPSPAEAMRHLRLTGVNALGRDGSASIAARKILREYPLNPDGSASLTYRPAYLIAIKEKDIRDITDIS